MTDSEDYDPTRGELIQTGVVAGVVLATMVGGVVYRGSMAVYALGVVSLAAVIVGRSWSNGMSPPPGVWETLQKLLLGFFSNFVLVVLPFWFILLIHTAVTVIGKGAG